MKLKNVKLGEWYRVKTKNHPAYGKNVKVDKKFSNGKIVVSKGHFDKTIYNLSSGDLE